MASEWKKSRPSWHNWPLVISERADDRYIVSLHHETAGVNSTVAEFATFAEARDHGNECLEAIEANKDRNSRYNVLANAGLVRKA